ncbi:RNA dependent RNA polymerase-domain-containing protein [Annulohypoxylon maeteangense]|uniref:RNA dependent RNA polymerase-domain-containing protein n=1 Tax=Annulohypoxylon maeteangense TaxID=1927788 RepID=UPI0020081310|nr:RNA dependent RNA polymerase-domain-containing protein [Annulohypoxylon maeteangense]KAI0887146.1 RNA dependent RNA polymerase-domain-containing protein [Annulohypoxylon maeteangense]
MAPRSESAYPPLTPSKPRLSIKDFDIWFLEFSNSYNLNLKRTPPELSPQKKRSLSYYSELKYYELLKVQYFKESHTIIQDLFDRGAKEIHSKWVKKPSSESAVTPFPTQLPRATTGAEREQLVELLRAILEDVCSTDISSSSSVSISLSHQEYDEPPTPTRSRRTKRHSDEWQGSPTAKRTRSVTSEVDTECDPDDYERPPSVLSVLDRGRVLTASPMPSEVLIQAPRFERTRPIAVNDSTRSVSTSGTTSASQVFSGRDEYELPLASQETQTTIVASNLENMKLPHLRQSQILGSDSDSLAPSSSTERALHISFHHHEQLQQNVRGLLRNDVSTYSDVTHSSEQDTTQPNTPSLPPASPPPSSLFTVPPTLSPIKESTKENTVGMPPPVSYGGSQNFSLEQRLHNVWPHLPAQYDQAPFVVRWEILRIALYCGIQMDDLRVAYDPSWTDQKTMWRRLQALPIFQGKSFPERSQSNAWAAALDDKFGTTDSAVILTASLSTNTSKNGPLFTLRLNPLKLDLSHRLSRRFGSDRFLELVIPSMNSQDLKFLGEDGIESIQQWLVTESHVLLGRVWTSFFLKPSLPKKINSDNTLMPQTKTIYQERIYLFAEDGNDFYRLGSGDHWSPKGETVGKHTQMGRDGLIDWLLQVPNNQGQSVLKLFSRITLGLSRTHATIVLRPEQIRHRPVDVLSPTGEVMNDGIALMSRGLAEAVRKFMGLKDTPAGFQGRFGSAKGFWIWDVTDTSDDIWIETSPSQRKWNCDYIEEDHRTFEVRNPSRELKSANLNLQLLPILEDRAIDVALMKSLVGKFLRDTLERDLEAQKAAMLDPTQFKLWVHENSPSVRRQERPKYNQVPFTAGLPTGREDIMDFLTDSGFEPTKLKFLSDMAWKMRMDKCNELKERLNVKVGRSTYAYMVVDFLGILEEDEVHLGFSSKFSDEHSGFSETYLHGMDALVARTPAHYPSDIQRVKVVFKPELGALKDVIIFPTKGNKPLADKLSGGDYDGDIAWVCWEPTIVNNFRNAEMPNVPDLFQQGIVRKENVSYLELVGTSDITSEFLMRAFRFNMQQNLLGMCTNYKERFCYAQNSVRNDPAILLSTLISHLVDRAKQGVVFTDQDWARLRKTLRRVDPPDPLYKKEIWSGKGDPTHIIDYVKFRIGNPTVETELKSFNESLKNAENYDKDLVGFYQHYEKFLRPYSERKEAIKKSTWETILDELRKDIDATAQEWRGFRGEWEARLTHVYDRWQAISPSKKANAKIVRAMLQEDQVKTGLSNWDLLKASFCFKMYYKISPSFVWYTMGRQLAYLKALRSGGLPMLITPSMYASMRPDSKFARVRAAIANERNFAEGEAIDEEEASTMADDEI